MSVLISVPIMQNVKKYFTNEKFLKEGLKYLDQSNLIFYFSELFPDKVFGEPQAVLDMVTEVVKEAHQADCRCQYWEDNRWSVEEVQPGRYHY